MSGGRAISKSRGAVPLAIATLALVGCGGLYDAEVAGIATLDGSALPRGTVCFHPVAAGPTAYGLIHEDGTYEVTTGREAGLPPGDYVVTVVANEPSVQNNPESGAPPAPGKIITPPWYRAKRSSSLKFTVEGGSNEINLKLTSDPPKDWKPKTNKRRRRR